MAIDKKLAVAVLATDGVEQIELTDPVRALRDEGAEVTVVSLKSGKIQIETSHLPLPFQEQGCVFVIRLAARGRVINVLETAS